MPFRLALLVVIDRLIESLSLLTRDIGPIDVSKLAKNAARFGISRRSNCAVLNLTVV